MLETQLQPLAFSLVLTYALKAARFFGLGCICCCCSGFFKIQAIATFLFVLLKFSFFKTLLLWWVQLFIVVKSCFCCGVSVQKYCNFSVTLFVVAKVLCSLSWQFLKALSMPKLIGIGSYSSSPLPQHRTYGSVYGA